MVTVDRGESTYIHLGCLLGLSHCRSRIMEKQNESVVGVECDQGGGAAPTMVKTQMVPLAQALPAAIVLVVESHHLHRGFIKERVVPRAPASATSSSSTSSIGVCDDPENADESEVQSPLRSGPLECMDALESSLPIKRGLSQFFDGKSRSFTSLKEVKEVSSAEQLSKPESPFNSKRRKLLNHTRRIPVSKSSANFKCRKDWSPPTFVRVTSSCLPRSFSHQHIISGVQNV